MQFKDVTLSGIALTAIAGTIVFSAYRSEQRKPQRPNILFCIADDASYHHFSANGCRWVNTPNFDRVAREGIRFSHCYTPNAKSAPSRATILTGKNSWQLREAGNHIPNFPPEIKVFTEALAESGYHVGFTGKGWAPGVAKTENGQPRLLTGKPYQNHQLAKHYPKMGNSDLAANFDEFMQNRNENQPFFFWMGSKEPHREYDYGIGSREGGKGNTSIDKVPAFWPDNDSVRTDMLDYAFEIEVFDRQIGSMLDVLEKYGELDNTLIVITSDNGMPFPRCKANNYEYANHMPLVMHWNNGIRQSGRTDSSLISFIDFAPTFLELAQINWSKSGMEPTPGTSMVDILSNRPTDANRLKRQSILLGRERHDYGRPNNEGYPIRAIIRDNMLYQINLKPERLPAGNPETGYLDVDGSPTKSVILRSKNSPEGSYYYTLSFEARPAEELYNLNDDSECINNLAQNSEFTDRKAALRAELFERLTEQNDPRLGPNGDLFDQYPFGDSGWNFYERVVSGELKEPWKETGWVNPSDYETKDRVPLFPY